MVIKKSSLLTKAIEKKNSLDVAQICAGWVSKQSYTVDDAFREGLELGRHRPKCLYSATSGIFTFFFTDEKDALEAVKLLPDQ